MDPATDDVSFRRVLAAPFGDSKQLRDALDIEVNGRSLSAALASAPFDLDVVLSEGLVSAWSRNSDDVAVLNCACGEVACGGIFVRVIADDRTITWMGPALTAPLVFDRGEFETSLARALSE